MSGDKDGRRGPLVAVHRAWVRHPRWSLALRGAIAAALAWVLGVFAPAPFAEYPYYAPLGAVIATTSTLARSVRESVQAVGALLLGAAIALAADAALAPGALSVALVVGVAMLCAGWRALGAQGVWVANSAIFVLILGQGEGPEYVGAFAGMVVAGAAIGIAVNMLLPSLLLTPSDLALDGLRDALVAELGDLAGWLEDEGLLEPAEWERRRQDLHLTIESARAAITRTGEASRGNLRARRHGARARVQARRAVVLGTSAAVVDEVVHLLVAWERTGRDDVALGPRLRPVLACALQSFAEALATPDGDDAPDGDRGASCAREVERLRDTVQDERERTGADHLVAGALVVVLRRGVEALEP